MLVVQCIKKPETSTDSQWGFFIYWVFEFSCLTSIRAFVLLKSLFFSVLSFVCNTFCWFVFHVLVHSNAWENLFSVVTGAKLHSTIPWLSWFCAIETKKSCWSVRLVNEMGNFFSFVQPWFECIETANRC